MTRSTTNLIFIIITIAIVAPLVSAQRATAAESIAKDRIFRQSLLSSGKHVPVKPKWGFFGTIFNLILEQVNDTKSAYNQISDLVNNNFADENAIPMTTGSTSNTTEPTKITRTEFLKILDRNFKGLNRLRNLEWREAKKHTHIEDVELIDNCLPHWGGMEPQYVTPKWETILKLAYTKPKILYRIQEQIYKNIGMNCLEVRNHKVQDSYNLFLLVRESSFNIQW